MATQLRQSNLFAAEDWKVVYQTFSQINLQSYDFDTIRSSIIDHIRTTYPDNFNDWIGNQEFIFILDTLSFLGQNLAFRMDLNTRENFIDTAERRGSIIRLAQMLAYSPKRNYPSRGLVKLTQISTTQDVKDSNGTALSSKTIKWNDPLNPDWYEQFILVLNANLTESNPFGKPVKKIYADDIQTQLYRLSTIQFSSVADSFTASVNGSTMNFEIVNPDIDNQGTISERHPNPKENKYIIYRNDGNGFDSPDTGFFLMFKQGTLKFDDYSYTTAIENFVQLINVDSINEMDVWVQRINDAGEVLEEWTKVLSTQNIMYNSVSEQVETIFSVITRDNDNISIRFPDSNTGIVPKGTFRVWYRVSAGTGYTIKTTDIQDKSVSFRTRSIKQTQSEESSISFKFSLQYQVQNSQPQETADQIRVRAPQMYYTSNRMITGEDYNIAPLAQGSSIKKAKAINRTYSGHSRFIDINDPTGKYQNTDIFSDDGLIYRDSINSRVKNTELLPSQKPESVMVVQSLQPLLGNPGTRQLFDENLGFWDSDITKRLGFRVEVTNVVKPQWIGDLTKTPYGAIGKFSTNFNSTTELSTGSLLKFKNPDTSDFIWASIVSYNSTTGQYKLSKTINSNWSVPEYYPALRTVFNAQEINNIVKYMYKCVDFGLYYNLDTLQWTIESDLTKCDFVKEFNIKSNHALVKVEYNGNCWNFIARGVDYIFVGGDRVKFFFVNTNKVSDLTSGTTQLDFIKILRGNYNPTSHSSYQNDINFVIDSEFRHKNGQVDSNRVKIKSKDMDLYGVPTEPEIYRSLVPKDAAEEIDIFWVTNENNIETLIQLPNSSFFVYDPNFVSSANHYKYRLSSTYKPRLDNSRSTGTVFYYAPLGIFIQYKVDRVTSGTGNYSIQELDANQMLNNRSTYLSLLGLVEVQNYRVELGRASLGFQWKHFAPDDHRIDPAITNINDMYVLTSNYYDKVQYWARSSITTDLPKPPTATQLKVEFKELEMIKAVSDTLVWNSGSFVPLFGSNAKEEYQCTFKVIKALSSRYSDDEIRQKVIELINTYFAIDNWDFGETFYFTELSTYIHQQLTSEISSIVIVPVHTSSKFGTLFEISCKPHELFVSTAKVSDVEIVNSLTATNLKVGR